MARLLGELRSVADIGMKVYTLKQAVLMNYRLLQESGSRMDDKPRIFRRLCSSRKSAAHPRRNS